MIPQRGRRHAILLILAALAIGCYESDVPVDPSPQAGIDSRVIGAWRCVMPDDSDEAVTITIKSSANRVYAITL